MSVEFVIAAEPLLNIPPLLRPVLPIICELRIIKTFELNTPPPWGV
jgi:hypothetical protein